ncbi:MAG: TerD family protein [Bacteroidota bacterium]
MAINLEKGQRIDLTKKSSTGAETPLTKFCVGVNWGAIDKEKKKLFGGTKIVKVPVDLDLSCIMLFDDGQRWDHLYSPDYDPNFLAKIKFPRGKLVSIDGALRHSGDDRTGDLDGDDGLDNEIISVDLTRIDPGINQIFFFLNNFTDEDFFQIPFAKIRMYEGTPTRVDKVYATFDVVSDPAYRGRRAMIMGKLYKKNGAWKFNAIGDATADRIFAETIVNIMKNYAQ